MLRLVVSGVWICALSLASVYFSMQMAKPEPKGAEPAPMLGGLDHVAADMFSIPVIDGGKVNGYFLARLGYTIDPDLEAKLTVPAKSLITDTLYTLLVGNRIIDPSQMDHFDLATFRARVKEALNARVGAPAFHDVLVNQIDYLTKKDIENRLNQGSTVVSTEKVAEAGDDGGH
ncbi:hypothetical protein [Pararhizobium mangrovi]|uniref:Flagellar basal body-associated protein FliL n=1 Tax=Pararhizobium mangrovi TaxID=2590452 RepID=A0A506TXW2_9HYPH|nr:hypothetical protein [Pararhizobium mangrovi]TPW26913.1 hypothetical protein FJU11_13140 [Pararhizobium mangrovi]